MKSPHSRVTVDEISGFRSYARFSIAPRAYFLLFLHFMGLFPSQKHHSIPELRETRHKRKSALTPKSSPDADLTDVRRGFLHRKKETMNPNKPYLLDLRADQIGYLPGMRCPNCGAGLIAKDGQLYRPFQALAGPAQEYDRCFGYLSFDCTCPLNMSQENNPALRGTLRVARLGDAVIPIDFVTLSDATLSKYGMTAREVNAARLQQAVRYLAAHADPASLAGSDTLKMVIYAVAGGSSPDAAYEMIQQMLAGRLPVRKVLRLPIGVRTNVPNK